MCSRQDYSPTSFWFVLVVACSLASAVQAADLRPLPGGERTTVGGFRAYLIDPISSYEHGVLGDTVEARGFAIKTQGRMTSFRLPRGPVFEDRRVRLADLDEDGRPEAIVIKSYPDKGSALAAYRILDDRIVPLAESVPIGRRHRWLNPVGVGNFTGTGEPMVAAVITPHISGSLRLFRLMGNSLDSIARIDGYTNHIRGSRDLDLGRAIDVDDDGVLEIVIPSLDRSSLAIISFLNGVAKVRKQIPVAGAIDAIESIDRASVRVRTDRGSAKLSLR
jgi:hypothetical protein